jgi:hypothetical protein
MRESAILSGILSLPIVGISAYALSAAWGELAMGGGISGLVLGLALITVGFIGLMRRARGAVV